jgi:hypothetical protein
LHLINLCGLIRYDVIQSAVDAEQTGNNDNQQTDNNHDVFPHCITLQAMHDASPLESLPNAHIKEKPQSAWIEACYFGGKMDK